MEFLSIVRSTDRINIIEQWNGVRTCQWSATTGELEDVIACAVRHGLVSTGMDRLDFSDGFVSKEDFVKEEN